MAYGIPYIKFFARDWMVDTAVRSMSLAARGLWIDMLMLMHQSPQRGKLLTPQGDTMKIDHLAKIVSAPLKHVNRLLGELESAKVFSRLDDGTIYSRRMVADETKRMACSEAGHKGGGNPKLRKTFKGDLYTVSKHHRQNAPKPIQSTDIQKDMSTYPPPLPPQGESGGGGDLGECPFDGDQVATDPASVLTPDGVSALNGWLGHASWSSHHATLVAQMVRDHGLAKVLEGIAISAEAGSRSLNYLLAVLKNGAKRLPKGKSGRTVPKPQTTEEVLAMFPPDRQAELRAQMARDELEKQAGEVF